MNFEDLDSRFNSWCHSEICRANHRFIPITIQFLKIELKHHSKKNMGEKIFIKISIRMFPRVLIKLMSDILYEM